MPKRTAPRASFSERPNARITYDGSMEFEVHAEPLENATSGMADINFYDLPNHRKAEEPFSED